MRNDIRDAFRRLRSTPGFTIVALLVLTLGIGASTAIYSVVDTVVLRSLPYDESDRLVWVGLRDTTTGQPSNYQSPQDFLLWSGYDDIFLSTAAVGSAWGFLLRDPERPPVEISAVRVSRGFFEVFRTAPRLGHAFSRQEADEGRKVIVISDGLWRGRFGADPEIVGRTVAFDSGSWEVAGVMPPDFVYPIGDLRPADIWAPWAPEEREKTRNPKGCSAGLRVTARLKDGVSLAQAHSRVKTGTAAVAEEFPLCFRNAEGAVIPLHQQLLGSAGPWMLLLLGAVGFVLLIACANVANMMLTRASVRHQEIQIRAALGADRWRIARELLTECLMLSLAGTVCALLVAWWGVGVLRSLLPESLPRISSISIDLRVLAVAAGAAIFTGLLSGLAPALRFSNPDLSEAMRDGGHGTAGKGRQRLRTILLISEVALALMLLVGAGLFVTSFIRVVGVDIGLNYRQVLTVAFYPPPPPQDTEKESAEKVVPAQEGGTAGERKQETRSRGQAWAEAATRDVMQRLRSLPGVEEVGLISGGLPLGGAWSRYSVEVPGRNEPFEAEDSSDTRHVTPSYRRVMGVRLLKGRYIEDTDRQGASPVVVLNQEAVRRYLGEDVDPIGAKIKIHGERTIVGVVQDARLMGPESPVRPEAYFSLWQAYFGFGGDLVIRTQGDPEELARDVRDIVWSTRPNSVMPETRTMESFFHRLVVQRELNMVLVSLFGMLALVIAAVGIYGVMAYVVSQRTPEVGLRLALGARPGVVLRMILSRALGSLGLGTMIGLGGAWLLAAPVDRFLFQVGAQNLTIYAAAAAALMLCGLAAAYLPARRAAAVDPLTALRAD